MGLPNRGHKFYAEYAKQSTKPFILSMHPDTPGELRHMFGQIVSTRVGAAMVEVNLSCPNVVAGNSNRRRLRAYLDEIRRATERWTRVRWTIGVKLPPMCYEREFDHVCHLLLQYTDALRFVTSINSVPNGLVLNSSTKSTVLHARGGFGGLGGAWCKPVGLANVAQLHRRLRPAIRIIGCGGIASGQDALEYILCGASAVQVGTHLLREGPDCLERITTELSTLVASAGNKGIQELIGTLRVTPPLFTIPVPSTPTHLSGLNPTASPTLPSTPPSTAVALRSRL
jgi:dihydroorotate dehydrogenase (fumarate)